MAPGAVFDEYPVSIDDVSESKEDRARAEVHTSGKKRRKLSDGSSRHIGDGNRVHQPKTKKHSQPKAQPTPLSRPSKPTKMTQPPSGPDSGDSLPDLPVPANIKVPLQSTSFKTLGLKPWLIHSLALMSIVKPTSIQAGCIPAILSGRDCIGGSRTGSGKTLAFAAPIMQKWAEDPVGIFAVVLTPTRELALQMFEQFKAVAASQSLKPVLVTGGADMRAQALELGQRPHVVIATPGRLADHIRTSGEDTICGLRRVRFVVLDEADRLLEAGAGSMLPDVEECLSVLPTTTQRQTCLFTATVTDEVRALKEMKRPPGRPPVFVCEVDANTLAVPATLKQMYLKVPTQHKEAFLHVMLSTTRNVEKSVMIFCNRTSTADLLEHLLRLLDHRVTALHSKLQQRDRIANLNKFRAGGKFARILVATDVAARGLDIPEVGLVINFDVPRDPDDYIHRVGRTARAGRRGESITLVGQYDVDLVLGIEERVGGQMAEFEEEGVSVEGRVVRDALKPVGEKKREAMLQIEQNRDVKGNKKREKLRPVQS